jgi:type III restriction enzyme
MPLPHEPAPTMPNPFFDQPILNSPYECPLRHWELDSSGQPTQRILEKRRRAEFITPIPKPKKRKKAAQDEMVFDEGKGLSTKEQQYDPTSIINEVRQNVDSWRTLPSPTQWQVTPETARLLQHWRHHKFGGVRPFFCQLEAVETAIWLTEVAPHTVSGKRLLEHLASANKDANPELMRLALKLATGAGKTTVMAMLIAWQTVNAVRRRGSKHFSRGFLVVAPGLTIKDRLRVLQPNDPDSYYKDRELVPGDMLDDVNRAKIVSPRQGVRLGGTAKAGNAPENRRGAVSGSPRNGEGGRGARLCAGGNARAAQAAPVRRHARRRTVGLRRPG